MSSFKARPKDPDAVLDYLIDWTDWLDGRSIFSSSVLVSGLDLISHSVTGAAHTVRVSGGVIGIPGKITSRITTDDGLEDDRTILIPIEER